MLFHSLHYTYTSKSHGCDVGLNFTLGVQGSVLYEREAIELVSTVWKSENTGHVKLWLCQPNFEPKYDLFLTQTYNKNMTTGHNIDLTLNLKNHKLQHLRWKVSSYLSFAEMYISNGDRVELKSHKSLFSISLPYSFHQYIYLSTNFSSISTFFKLWFSWHCCQCCWLLLHLNVCRLHRWTHSLLIMINACCSMLRH